MCKISRAIRTRGPRAFTTGGGSRSHGTWSSEFRFETRPTSSLVIESLAAFGDLSKTVPVGVSNFYTANALEREGEHLCTTKTKTIAREFTQNMIDNFNAT